MRIGPTLELGVGPRFYRGCIEHFCEEGRGSATLETDCYRTDMHIYAGASGGPVFNRRGNQGAVFAVNSSAFNTMPDVSFITPLYLAREMPIPTIYLNMDEHTTLADLIRLGIVKDVSFQG